MRLSPQDVNKALDILGFTEAEMKAPLRVPSLAAARAQLDDLKARVKKSWRRVALDLHPDRHPEREDDFKLVSNVYEELMKLELGQQRPQPVRRPVYRTVVVTVNMGGGFTTNGTSSTTSTWVRWP